MSDVGMKEWRCWGKTMTDPFLFALALGKTLGMTGLGPGILLMGLYNFREQFTAKILSGEKQHTIRRIRAVPDKPGNMLHLYTGLRHKGAKLLMRVSCVKVEEIEIDVDETITIDGHILSEDECEALARRDGFRDFLEMCEFWDGRRPFKGHIIHWQFSNPSSGTGS